MSQSAPPRIQPRRRQALCEASAHAVTRLMELVSIIQESTDRHGTSAIKDSLLWRRLGVAQVREAWKGRVLGRSVGRKVAVSWGLSNVVKCRKSIGLTLITTT